MRWGLGYPLEAIGEGLRSSFIRAVVIFTMVFIGSWSGLSIRCNHFVSLAAWVEAMAMATITAIMNFPSAFAFLVAVLAWYLPAHFESPLFAIVSALATLLVWLVFAYCGL